MIPSQHRKLIHELVSLHLDGEVLEIADKSPGFSGCPVYSVQVGRTIEPCHPK
jgi:hypothetical protein